MKVVQLPIHHIFNSTDLHWPLGHPVERLKPIRCSGAHADARANQRGNESGISEENFTFPLMMAAAAAPRASERAERKGEPLVARDTIYGNRPTAGFNHI